MKGVNHTNGENHINRDNHINGGKLTNGHEHTNGNDHTITLDSNVPPSVNGVSNFLSPSKTFSPKAGNMNHQFWAAELANLPGPPPRCNFAKAARRGSQSNSRCHHVSAVLGRALNSGVHDLSAELGVTPAAFTFAALSIMLSRTLDADEEFFVALVLQPEPSRTGVTAPFLPIRLGPKLEEKASDIVRTTYAKQNMVVQHADVDMLALLDQTVGSGNSWRELIPAGFSYELLPRGTALDPRHPFAASTTLADNDTATSFDLHLHIAESQDTGCAYLTLAVPEILYTYVDAKSLIDRYLHVIRAMQTDVSLQVKNCPLFDLVEGRHAVHLGKGPRIKFNELPTTLLHKIDEVACTVPGSIAVKDSLGNQLTYSEMLRHIGAIANALLQHNLSKGDRVAVYCEPSIDSLCSLLAITRIGCVYVPLDLRNPVERLASIVDDCDPSVIIFHGLTAQGVAGVMHPGAELLNIATLPQENIDSTPPFITSTSSDPAFVLYTSGSTGRPKGVLLSHGNFLGQIAAVHREFILKRERVLQQSSLGFDTSLHQIFVALTTGGTVIIARRDIRGDPVKLSELMLAERVTFTVGVPSEYSVLLRYGNAQLRQYCDWRYAVSGGERMTTALKQEFCALGESGPILLSCYGPTEVALASSFGVLEYSDPELGADDENSPVGFTLPNYSIYVLDEKMRPVPQGFPGEVYIGGVGVACGYLRNEKLSNERFLPDPFADQDDAERGWTRMYRTGDKGRLLPNGALSFLGRIDGDSQIKLRGIRIELEEVANVIVAASEGLLHQAAVIVRGSSEHKYMVSFVTFSPGQQPDDTSSYLQKLLDSLPIPIYMRPVALLQLDKMPMNVNGKLDRRALSSKPIAEFQQNNVADGEIAGPTEKRLKQIWEEVIRPRSHSQDAFRITLDSDFFQVGGNSILLVEIQKRIFHVFGKTIRWLDLFLVSVLRDMAARIDGKCSIAPSPAIDWTRELEEYLDRVKQPIEPDVEPAKVVLLTGSTGFLGSHLLRQLIENPHVSRIHAVAVRHHHLENQPNGSTPRFASISSPKLQIWQGDLRLPGLGLSTRDMAYLADTVDIVIHNGADVSFLKSYQSLHAPNVGSTIELCRLALKRNIPFHFVSSAGVLRLAHDLEAVGEVSMTAYQPPSDGSDGYVASKWASEQLLEKVAKQIGLRVHIHRPTSVTGEGIPETDVMANLLRFSCAMNAVPTFPGAHGVFNMVRVEDVVEGILREALGRVQQPRLEDVDCDGYNGLHDTTLRPETGQVCWTHHAGAAQILVDGLGEYLQNEQEEAPRKLSLKDWVAEAMEHGLNENVASVLNTPEAARGHGMTIPRLL
ncbi:hypothetical protein DL765_004848 [Monosporascus sp. GIB2]|nr:hypothetical protein DL765_004848 [Monosporascus sp. GIB2]